MLILRAALVMEQINYAKNRNDPGHLQSKRRYYFSWGKKNLKAQSGGMILLF